MVRWCVWCYLHKWAGTDLGCNGKVGRGDSVAVQGMWRPPPGHMTHAFLRRNHKETMVYFVWIPGYGEEQVWPVVKERVLLLFQPLYCTYADLNSTVAVFRGLVYQLVLQERSLLHIL